MAQVVPLFFVEEKHAIVCQTDFAGCGIGATSHQCHLAQIYDYVVGTKTQLKLVTCEVFL